MGLGVVSAAMEMVSPTPADPAALPVSTPFDPSSQAASIPANKRLAAKLSEIPESRCMATLLSRHRE
jgi:hypothetical protein